MSPGPNGEVCSACAWWVEQEHLKVGNCRKAPPVPLSNSVSWGIFPLTTAEDWCGGFTGVKPKWVAGRRVNPREAGHEEKGG